MVGLLVLLFPVVPIAGATQPEAGAWLVEAWEEPPQLLRSGR